MGMSNILFVGDVHGNLAYLMRAMIKASRLGIKNVVQVGDFHIYSSQEQDKLERVQRNLCKQFGFPVIVHFIDGNHENFNLIDPHDDSPIGIIPEVLYYYPRGTTLKLEGVNIGFFGGAHTINQHLYVAGHSWFPDEIPNYGDIERALSNFTDNPIDVLVTHDIPNFAEKQVRYDPIPGEPIHYVSKQDEDDSRVVRETIENIVDYVNPRIVIHGHWHYFNHDSYHRDSGDNTMVDVVSLAHDDKYGSTVVLDHDKNNDTVSVNIVDDSKGE